MTDVTILAGDLTANHEDRVVSGLLLPFGEVGNTNLGRFSVDAGVFEIPADVSVLNANEAHDPREPRARFLTATETPAGIVSTFKVGQNPEGDDLLARIEDGKKNGKPVALSVEVKNVAIRAGRAIAGKLIGAAFVDRGAFPSATLLASDVGTDEIEPIDDETDEEKIARLERELAESRSAQTPETPAPEPVTTTQKEPTVAAVPSTLAATAAPDNTTLNASDVFDLITQAMTGQGGDETLLAALTDIKISGNGQLPVGGNAVQPSWLGEVWSAKSYERRYMPLIRNGNITAIDEKGFAVTTADEPVKAWAGNKAELPTTSGTTSALTSAFQRWGVANDIAREFYDIPAGRPVIEAYIRLLVNSYSRVTDKWTLQQLYAAVSASQQDADTYPTDYPEALGKLVQAIDAVDDTDADPSFAIVASDVWTELRYTPKDQIPEYVTFGFGRQEGRADGVRVVRDKFNVLSAGQVLAGGYDVAHVNELPGGAPLQLDALDIAHGGIDKAVIGYTQYMTEYAAGLVLVGDDPTP